MFGEDSLPSAAQRGSRPEEVAADHERVPEARPRRQRRRPRWAPAKAVSVAVPVATVGQLFCEEGYCEKFEFGAVQKHGHLVDLE